MIQERKVIFLTNQWPRESEPHCGIVVVRQAASLRRLGVQVEVASIAGSIRSYLRAAWKVFCMNFERRRADVLHAHTGHSGILACLQLRYPVILTYVGYDIDTPAEDREGLRTQFERLIFRSLSMFFAGTIAQSARGARRLPRPGRRRNSVIPNGVDPTLFVPRPREDARRALGWGSAPTAFFAADPNRYTKRFELAEAAIGLARQEVPDLQLVVADGVPTDQMPLWMNAADVLLLTSRGEGSPNVVKEAMFCNLPIVSVDVGDVREVVGATRHCRICPDDPVLLARAVLDAVRAIPERSDGRERSAGLVDHAVAAQLIELYDRARHRRPGLLGFLPLA